MSNKINSEDSVQAIRAIKSVISPSESYAGKANIDILKNGRIILKCKDIEIRSSYEVSYMQYRVSIMWEDCGIENWSSFGLRGSYNTNFNSMDEDNGALVIHADDVDIVIHPQADS